MIIKRPEIVDFSRIGKPIEGYISIAEVGKNVNFEVKRIFWTYFTPENVIRGRHAHRETEMILIAVAGRIIVNTETIDGIKETFYLESPDQGVYLPTYCWHTMQYSHNAVQMVLTSTLYSETDYIRDYETFKQIK
jgi:dTDP-4-dehydrorhamnose 3,5-epimerase-like enzyme